MQDKATAMHNDGSEGQEEKNTNSVIITSSSRHFEVEMYASLARNRKNWIRERLRNHQQ